MRKVQHLQNIWVYRRLGNSSKVPLVGQRSAHHYKFVKEDAKRACQLRSQEEAPTIAVPAMQVLCELIRNLKKQSTVIHFRHTLFYIFKSVQLLIIRLPVLHFLCKLVFVCPLYSCLLYHLETFQLITNSQSAYNLMSNKLIF